MSNSGYTPEDFAMDRLILARVTEACSEVLGDRKAAERVALKVSVDTRVEYAALCYIGESEPWETLVAAVRDALPVSEPAQAPEVFTREQAETDLGRMYTPAEVAEILETADACGYFTDDIAWNGENLHVYVRAHGMSVNEPVSYTITIR